MRIQVFISDEMVKRVDKYAKEIGVSRSALCSMLIGQGVMGLDRGVDMVENALNSGRFDDILKSELLNNFLQSPSERNGS